MRRDELPEVVFILLRWPLAWLAWCLSCDCRDDTHRYDKHRYKLKTAHAPMAAQTEDPMTGGVVVLYKRVGA